MANEVKCEESCAVILFQYIVIFIDNCVAVVHNNDDDDVECVVACCLQ
jgi:hypothetical protein